MYLRKERFPANLFLQWQTPFNGKTTLCSQGNFLLSVVKALSTPHNDRVTAAVDKYFKLSEIAHVNNRVVCCLLCVSGSGCAQCFGFRKHGV